MRSLVLLLALSLTAASAPAIERTRVKPLDQADFDFVRHRDPDLWRNLTVERIAFHDGPAHWQLWRITNRKRADGPLWVVPHDNENAAFSAALYAVIGWGGELIAVDTGVEDLDYTARFNRDVATGERIDPNRAFDESNPLYVATVLARRANRPIVALHTNAPGFDPDESTCGPPPRVEGSGSVSIELCNRTYSPRPSPDRRWPFDDSDTLAILPHLAADPPGRGWCAAALERAGYNISYERVVTSDGSLSNYAVQHGIPYLNFETRDRGNDAAGVAAARDRLLAMIDVAMEQCLGPEARLMTPRGGRDRASP